MELDANDPRLKTWGIALGVVVVTLALVDLVVLKGEHVASASIDLRADSSPGILEIVHPGQEHRVQIATRKRIRGEYEGQSIAWTLVAPDGTTIDEESEFISRKKRFFDFRPTQKGAYELHIEETKLVAAAAGRRG